MQNKIDLNIARTLEDFQTLILAIKFGQLDIMDLNNDGYTININTCGYTSRDNTTYTYTYK